MLKKQYRLSESIVAKALRLRKQPFFSNNWIANGLPNRLGYNRFAIILSGKNTKTSVNRNFFRRRFYTLAASGLTSASLDLVFVAKKGKTFDKTRPDDIVAFETDVKFLLKIIGKSSVSVNIPKQ